MKKKTECSGHCCRSFFFPITPQEFRDSKIHERNKIADMLVPLGIKNDEGYWYTCRHFKNGRCQDYENRPHPCRSYAESYPCVNIGCTHSNSCSSPAVDKKNPNYDRTDIPLTQRSFAARIAVRAWSWLLRFLTRRGLINRLDKNDID